MKKSLPVVAAPAVPTWPELQAKVALPPAGWNTQSPPVVVSLSGGKDSVAVALVLRKLGIAHHLVFADTEWEAPETYAHLAYLEGELGQPITRVTAPGGGMAAQVRTSLRFPSRLQRWCTTTLKVQPLRTFHDSFDCDTISVVGVRAQESADRAALPAWEFSDSWGGYVWRPLLRWTTSDVLAIHLLEGVKLNPLYALGHDRVGCYPCIFAGKSDLRAITTHAPERMAQLASLEAEITEARARHPGRFSSERATFFMCKREVVKGYTTTPQGKRRKVREYPIMGALEVAQWARSDRSGKVLRDVPLEGGCYRWGLCEPAKKEEQ